MTYDQRQDAHTREVEKFRRSWSSLVAAGFLKKSKPYDHDYVDSAGIMWQYDRNDDSNYEQGDDFYL
jgi:hypothetical protein